uniref:Putative acetyltransferase At3g50280-like n=1 Tax=Rhizophora mucronata TaxID=61149 RepID=A0A2P2JGE3_RHIMU
MVSTRIISTSTIGAANHKHNEPTLKVELTPWDLQFLLVGPIQKGLLFLKPASSSYIQQLKASLSRTLDFFGPLAGRPATVEHGDGSKNNTSFYFDCNNAGALFVHAAADGVTVTELENGIFIGCTMSHVVGDGTSFWHFLNSWSEICRGLADLSKPPVHKRCFLDGSDSPILIPGLTNKQELSKSFNPPPLKERIFHFTKTKIAQLKATANAEIGTNKISSLQALFSHLWRGVVRSRSLDPDQETQFWLLVGTRSRLNPPLPEGYFGNAVQPAAVTLKAKEMLDNGLGYTARQMNNTVACNTEEKSRNFFKDWIENPKLTTVGNLPANAFNYQQFAEV